MAEELTNLQPCTLHLYCISLSLLRPAVKHRGEVPEADPGPCLYTDRMTFSTLGYKRPLKMNIGLKAVLYKLFFITLMFPLYTTRV